MIKSHPLSVFFRQPARVLCWLLLLLTVPLKGQANTFTQINVNDWGSGFIASFEYVITADDTAIDVVRDWTIDIAYTGSASITNAWMNGFSGNIRFENPDSTGRTIITTEGVGFRPELEAGYTLGFSVQGSGSGFQASDFAPQFLNLTAPPSNLLASTLVNVNDWYNPNWGGGFNATFRCDITDPDTANGPVTDWTIEFNYSGSGNIGTAWTQSYNGSTTHGFIADDNGYAITNVQAGFQPELYAGDSITVAIQVLDSGFNTADFDMRCIAGTGPLIATNTPPGGEAASYTLDENGSLAFSLAAIDAENDTLTVTVVSSTANGTLSGTAPDLIYTPDANYVGPDQLTYQISDGQADSPVYTIDLTINPITINNAPVADEITLSTTENESVTVQLSATDSDGDALTFSIVSDPANGTLSGTGSTLSYLPNAGFSGTDAFTYSANDGNLASEPVTVSINVNAVNNAPTATDQSATSEQNSPIAITLSGDDPDGDTLTYTVVSDPSNGTLSGTPPQLVYTPNAGFVGVDAFGYQVSDGQLDSSVVTVTIAINNVNDAPVAQDLNVLVLEDTPVELTLDATDADGDALSYTLTGDPTNGTLVGTPPLVTYTPATNYFGTDLVVYEVSDGLLTDTVEVTITIEPVNDAPVAEELSIATDEGQAVDVALSATDPDNDSVTYSITTPPANGTLEGTAPDLTYLPNPGFSGTDEFSYVASDDVVNSEPATVAVQITGVNEVPVISGSPPLVAIANQTWTYQPEISDPDGDALTIELIEGPDGVLVDPDTGELVWVPSADDLGEQTILIRVTDPDGQVVEQQFTVSVVGDEPPITHEGTEFWLTFMQNHSADDDNNFSIYISSETGTSGQVDIPILSKVIPFTVNPGSVETIKIDDPAEIDLLSAQTTTFRGKDSILQTGIHITTDSPVTVYALNQKQFTSDGLLVLPTSALGLDYPLVAYTDRLYRTGLGSQAAVVATQDNTTIRLQLSRAVNLEGAGNGNASSYGPEFQEVDDEIVRVLNRGETYYVTGSISGSFVNSDKPVAVFSGNICVSILNGSTCDHLVEQMPPTHSFGSEYFTQPLAWRVLGDRFIVVPFEDETELYVGNDLFGVLEKGRAIDFVLDEATRVWSNKPFMLVQASHSNNYDSFERRNDPFGDVPVDPFMAVLTSNQQYLSSYLFTTPTEHFQWNFVNVQITQELLPSLTLDGNPVDETLFAPIDGTDWMSAALPVSIGIHRLSANGPFGAMIYGYDVFDSYGYMGGASLGNSADIAGLNVIEFENSALITANEFCTSVESVNASGGTAPFTPVSFEVSGSNEVSSVVLANAGGIAEFCYVGYLPGTDSVVASSPELETTLGTINWTLDPTTNGAPVFGSPPELYTYHEASYSSAVVATDPEGFPVIYEIVDGPTGLSIDSQSGVINWQVPADEGGVFTHFTYAFQTEFFTVSATDAEGASSTQRYRLSDDNGNTPPEFTSEPILSATRGTRLDYLVTAFDPNRMQTSSSSFQHPGVSFYLEEGPGGVGPANTSSDGTSRATLRWNVGNYSESTADVTVVATDWEGGITRQSFTIEIQDNLPPEFTTTPSSFIAYVGRRYNYEIDYTDPEDQPISLLPTTFDLPRTSFFVPPGSRGLFTWLPNEAQLGDHVVTLRLRDPAFNITEQVFTVTVLPDPNTAPAIDPLTPGTVFIGSLFSYQVDASDADDEPLNYSIVSGPSGMTIDPDTGLIEWTVSGTANSVVSAEIAVSDGITETTRSFDLTLSDTPPETDPPVITLDTEPGASISGQFELIGSITDENMGNWSVTALRSGTDAETPLNTGSGVIENLSLATLDTTLLRNGLYTLIVSATDTFGNAAEQSLPVVIDGNDKVGTFSVSFEDLSIPMLGVPIEINRTHDSRRRSEELDFGHGWSIDYQNVTLQESGIAGAGWSFIDEFVLVEDGAGGSFPIRQFCVKRDEPAFVTVTLPDDSVDKFRVMAGPECNIANAILDVNLDFEPLDDTTSTLQALDDNFGRLNNTLGVLSDVAETDPLDPQRYALTTQAGYVYILSEDFGLEEVQDPNGNTLSYTNNGIIHSAGKSVLFVRDGSGRITRIQDPSGNQISYTYDLNDDLTAVTDRESSTTTMTYNNDHGLIDIIDPLGNNFIRNIYDNDGRLIAQEDNLGNRTDFNHNLTGRESIVTDRLGRVTLMNYDERGNVTAQINALGEITTYTYDANDNQLSETNALGESSSATFDAENNQLTQTDGLNNTIAYAYNNLGQEITITDARGNTFNNAYDPVGNLLSITDPAGNITTQTLNANGLVNSRTDAEGFVTNFIYDNEGNVTREIDAAGAITDYTDDTNNNRTSETRKRTVNGQTVDETTSYTYNSRDQLVSTTDALGNTTTTEYDLLGRESATVDPLGRRTEMAYDAYGRLISTTYSDGTSNTMTYDVEGNKLTDTDRLGRTTTYTYDALNRLITTTNPDSTSTSMTYDAAGRISTETDERGNTTTHSYDAAGRRTTTTDALGNTLAYAYDADGNMVSMTDARNHATSYTYNNLDQRIRTTYADNTTMESGFDGRGMETSKTDQNGRITNYSYDGQGRLTGVTDTLGQTTTYGYDEVGNQLTQTDALSRTTTWTYDALGRQTTRTLPLDQVESYVYDAVGNRTSHTDFNGATHTFVYEANNDWLVAEQYADNQVIGYSYNAVGNRTAATDSNGTTTYSYDSRNRLINEIKHDGSELIYGYDESGNKITMSSIVSGTTRTTGYTYDSLNRMATVTDANGGVTTYTYDENGNQTGIAHSNGTSTSTTFDDLNRISLIEHKDDGGNVMANFSYTLDPTGRRTTIAEEDGRNSNYTYDDLYRLIGEDIMDPVNGNHAASWTYDAVGNRLSDTTNGVTTSYAYDANDRLLTQGSKSFTYDANGSTTSESDGTITDTFVYDSRKKLVEAMVDGSLIAMSYDMDGNRVGKSVGGNPVNYVVDNNQSHAQVVVEEQSSDTLDYTFGTDLLNLDSLSGGYTYHTDALGSNRLITDFVGNSVDELGYGAWGYVLSGGGLAENQYRYAGEQFDTDLDQIYLRARYLVANRGVFVTRDLFEGYVGSPETLHDYSYVIGDPTNLVDPSGLSNLFDSLGSLQINNTLSKSSYPTYNIFIRKVGNDLICYAIEEAVESLIEDIIFSGVYVLQDRGQFYIGESADADRRLKQHKSDIKKTIEGTLARFRVVRERTAADITDKNARNLIEQLSMNFFSETETTNERRAIAENPRSESRKKLKGILDKLDLCPK